jgi:hypothetical protein
MVPDLQNLINEATVRLFGHNVRGRFIARTRYLHFAAKCLQSTHCPCDELIVVRGHDFGRRRDSDLWL